MKTIFLLQDCGHEGCTALCAFTLKKDAEAMEQECISYDDTAPRLPDGEDAWDQYTEARAAWEKKHPLYGLCILPGFIEGYHVKEVNLL